MDRDDVQAWLGENWFRAGILVVILIAAGTIAQYYMVFLPGQAKLLDACLADSDITYTLDWNTACKSLNRENGCTLTSSLADNVNMYQRDRQANYFRRYRP